VDREPLALAAARVAELGEGRADAVRDLEVLARLHDERPRRRARCADLESVFRAVTSVDMVEIPKTYPAVRGLFAARGAAERLVNALLGRPAPTVDADNPMRLGDMPEHGDWVKLADDPPRELAFGVIGRFWGGETVWEAIDAADFAAFERPGFAKIACSVSLRPYGSVRTLVSYEARTQALDAESRAAFLRYWRLVRPGVAIVMRAFLQAVAKEAR
jgi:hypothetical protein